MPLKQTQRVGVLALQGGFEEHQAMLRRLGVSASAVRTPDQLETVDALILPGGESTTMAALLHRWAMFEPLQQRVKAGMPVWGTCAGAVVMAQHADRLDHPTLGLMHITVQRNAFGRQIDSFVTPLAVSLFSDPYPAVFIRAPSITVVGDDAEILACLDGGAVVAVREGNALATAFHPELTQDMRFHEYFLSLI